MTSSNNYWDAANGLQNSSEVLKSTGSGLPPNSGRVTNIVPPLPPKPMLPGSAHAGSSYGNSYMPSALSGFGGYGSYNSYGSYSHPYRNSLYSGYGYGSSYGGYGNGMYGAGNYPNYPSDDAERRFIQYAEESSRNTFANVESVVRAFNSLAMMVDNTFFAMTSSFRAVLGVAENFGRLRSMFGHIWYSVNVFRFFSWLYRKIRMGLGLKVPRSPNSVAWSEAAYAASPGAAPSGSNWPTVAFLGVLISAPYIISKFLPKYVDKSDSTNWKSPGVRAKACFDFIATNPGELTIHTNDIITLAPSDVQDEMKLKNTGWAYAVLNGKAGVVPLNYLVISKNKPILHEPKENVPIPRIFNNGSSVHKTHTKRVSFGANQIFENIDLNDYNEQSSCKVNNESESVVQGKVTENKDNS